MNYYIELFWPHEPEASGRELALWYHPKKRKKAESIQIGDRVLLYETGSHPDFPDLRGSKRIFASATVVGALLEVPSSRVSIVGNRNWNLSVPIIVDVQISRDSGIEWSQAREILGWRKSAALRSGPIRIDSKNFKALEQILKEKSSITSKSRESQDEQIIFSEGKKFLTLHWHHERDRRAVKAIKKKILDNDGTLFCSLCGFSFEEKYGYFGKGIMDVHHLKPISTLTVKDRTRIDDLVVLCPNCHRFIHSKWPPYSVSDVKMIVKH